MDQQAETTSSSGTDEDCPVSDQWFNIDFSSSFSDSSSSIDSENTLRFKAVSEDNMLSKKSPQISHYVLFPSLSDPCKPSRTVTFSPYIKIKLIPPRDAVPDTTSFSLESSSDEIVATTDSDISGSNEDIVTKVGGEGDEWRFKLDVNKVNKVTGDTSDGTQILDAAGLHIGNIDTVHSSEEDFATETIKMDSAGGLEKLERIHCKEASDQQANDISSGEINDNQSDNVQPLHYDISSPYGNADETGSGETVESTDTDVLKCSDVDIDECDDDSVTKTNDKREVNVITINQASDKRSPETQLLDAANLEIIDLHGFDAINSSENNFKTSIIEKVDVEGLEETEEMTEEGTDAESEKNGTNIKTNEERKKVHLMYSCENMNLSSVGRENNPGISEIREEVCEDVNVVNFSEEEVVSNRER